MITQADIKQLQTRADAEQFFQTRYGGDEAALLTDLDAGLNHLLRTDLIKMAAYAEAVGAFSPLLSPGYRPRLVAMRARTNHRRGLYADALRQYRQARRDFIRHRNFLDAARTGLGLMDVHMYLGRYREAIETGRKSLRYFQKQKMAADAARVMTNIGNVYHRLDNNRMAMRYYDRARAVFKKEGGIPLAIVEYNRANIATNLNELKKAAALYRLSAEIYGKANLGIAENQARYALAYLLYLEHKYSEALKVFEDVYEAFSTGGDVKSAAITQLDLVEMNLELNQYGSAVMMGESLIDRFKELGMRYEQGKSTYFVAVARARLGDESTALRQLGKAERLFVREHNLLWQGMVSYARTQVNLSLGKNDRAVASSGEARALFRKSGDERRIIDAEIVRIEALMKGGEEHRAIAAARKLTGRRLLGYQQYNLSGLSGLYHYRRGEFARSLKHYLAAVKTAEDMIAGLYPDEIRFFFVVDKYDSYMKAVDCLLKLGKVNQAFLSSLQALTILNQRNVTRLDMSGEVPEKLLEARDALRAALKKLSAVPRGGDQRAGGFALHLAEEQKFLTNERRIRACQYPGGAEFRQEGIENSDPASMTRPGEVLLNYTVLNGRIGAFRAVDGRNEFVPLDISFANLELLVRKTHFLCESAVFGAREDSGIRQAVDGYCRRLYDSLVRPLLNGWEGRDLVILTDGTVGQVPFGILLDDGGNRLCGKHDISLLANPRDLLHRVEPTVSFAGSRNSIFAVTSDVLPAVDVEAQRVAGSFRKARLHLGESATRENLILELGRADGFVHIATHASRSSENPLFSRVLMGDGPFFPFDLFGTGIMARLVTLSGCQTAAPGLYYGNSFSLAKAFYQAGARQVLATLWPVSDKVSMMFMVEFYRNLRRSNDVAVSYRGAVEIIRGAVDNPALWGAFVLLGI